MKRSFISKIYYVFLAVLLAAAVLPASIKKAGASELSPDFVAAKSAYLCDYGSGTLIYSKNETERKPIASMTKIMLLLLAFEKEAAGQISFDDRITISENASGMGGSQVFLQADGEYNVGELIKSIIISSANDSSVAIAELMFGSEENAVDAMNEKAKSLNLADTLFSNCTGLTRPTQYSCAKDVAVMLSELIKYDKYFLYSKIYLDEMEHEGGRKTQMTNTNKLVKFYNGCDGGKTGFTNEAGFCLAATAKRGATRLIGVVIGESDSKKRFADCSALFDYGFNNFASKCVVSSSEPSGYQVEVKGGKLDFADVSAEDNLYVFGRKNEKDNIRIDCVLSESVKAPIKKGDVVGKFVVYKDNVKIAEKNAVCLSDVHRKTYGDYLKEITSY